MELLSSRSRRQGRSRGRQQDVKLPDQVSDDIEPGLLFGHFRGPVSRAWS